MLVFYCWATHPDWRYLKIIFTLICLFIYLFILYTCMWAYDTHMPQYTGGLWELSSCCQAWRQALYCWAISLAQRLFLYYSRDYRDLMHCNPPNSDSCPILFFGQRGPLWLTPETCDPRRLWRPLCILEDWGAPDGPWKCAATHLKSLLRSPDFFAGIMLRDHNLDLSNMHCYWTGHCFWAFPVDELGNTPPHPTWSGAWMPDLGINPHVR